MSDLQTHIEALPEDQQRTIRWLTERLATDPEPEEPTVLEDFDTAYHAVHSTLCVLTVDDWTDGMEHHYMNMMSAALPHMSRLKYEYETTVTRLQKTSLELEQLKARTNQ